MRHTCPQCGFIFGNEPNPGCYVTPEFKALIKQKRFDLDITQAQLAEKINCGAGTVQYLEDRTHESSSKKTVEKVIAFLGLPARIQEIEIGWTKRLIVKIEGASK